MLSKLCLSNDSGNFTAVSSVRFIALCIATLYIYIYTMTAERRHVAYSS